MKDEELTVCGSYWNLLTYPVSKNTSLSAICFEEKKKNEIVNFLQNKLYLLAKLQLLKDLHWSNYV